MTLTPADDAPSFRLLILAKNRNGYGNLCEFITLARTRAEKGEYLSYPSDVDAPAAGYEQLRGLPDCELILLPKYGASQEELVRWAGWLHAIAPGRSHVALTLHHRADDEAHKRTVLAAASAADLPLVATGNVCMHVRSYKPIQDTMTAIRIGKPIARCGFDLAPNAEQHLRSRLRLANLYPRTALAQSIKIANSCTFSLDELRYEYPDVVVPAGMSAAHYLRQEAYCGAYLRYPDGIPGSVVEQVERELALIAEMRYESYFLTVYDIVRFARSKKILCQGRGSAANSAVCFCLGITEVDPARASLLFERFISRERNEPPDIDVDFEHQRREEVIQYIYEKYSRTRAGLTAVVTSYRSRSVLRDVGAALGVDLSIVDKVAKEGHRWGHRPNLEERMQACGLPPGSDIAQKWIALSEHMMNFPRHLSQHPGGFVLSQGKLSRLVPIENARMENRSIIQWDKDDLDALGILKVDILALGMLSCIRRTLGMISDQIGQPFELADIPAEDPATYEMISRADTVGVFQIESRGQMSMLPRMQPRQFYDLVIEVAIIRPGPIQGGMIQPYLARRDGSEPVTYPSPEMEAVLSRTLGIPIFQEQVMQIAMVAAGFTAGEADQLRRAMAAWKRKGGLEPFEDKLRSGMAQRGYDANFADGIVAQIRGFAEYGFPESHAASFALLAYASSWLKRHHPAPFLASLVNSQPMGFYSISQLVQDARRHGVEVLPVDVQVSNWETSLEPRGAATPAVRLGLNVISGFEGQAGERIELARSARAFDSVHDLALRADLDASALKLLASASALASLTGNRREALWTAAGSAPEKGLLRPARVDEDQLRLEAPTEAEDIEADYRHTGLTLGRHPLALLRPTLAEMRFSTSEDMSRFGDNQLARVCGLVTVRQRPETANGVVFVTLEDETGNTNIIVWPDLADRQRKELLQASLLGVYGQCQFKNNVRHLVAMRLLDLSHLLGNLATMTRSFR